MLSKWKKNLKGNIPRQHNNLQPDRVHPIAKLNQISQANHNARNRVLVGASASTNASFLVGASPAFSFHSKFNCDLLSPSSSSSSLEKSQ